MQAQLQKRILYAQLSSSTFISNNIKPKIETISTSHENRHHMTQCQYEYLIPFFLSEIRNIWRDFFLYVSNAETNRRFEKNNIYVECLFIRTHDKAKKFELSTQQSWVFSLNKKATHRLFEAENQSSSLQIHKTNSYQNLDPATN